MHKDRRNAVKNELTTVVVSSKTMHIIESVEKAKRLFVFGAGRNARILSGVLRDKDLYDKVYAYVDNDESKEGTVFNEKDIISPTRLISDMDREDLLIISVEAYREVLDQLDGIGMHNTNILLMHDYLDAIAENSIHNCLLKMYDYPIRIGFLTQRITTWNKLAPTYEAMVSDDRFRPILLIANKYDFARSEISKGGISEAFRERYPENEIVEVDNSTDVSSLGLEYMFLPAPYDRYMPENFHSSELAKKVKLCYIPYGYNGAYNFSELNTERSFFRNIHLYMGGDPEIISILERKFENGISSGANTFVDLGYPAIECMLNAEMWDSGDKSILWTPRWSYDERLGGSHFFEYLDTIYEISKIYSGYKIKVRPHPLMFESFIKDGMMDEGGISSLRSEMSDRGIVLDESSDANDAMMSASILISDYSSLILEYFITGRPIIYCQSDVIRLNDAYQKLLPGMYVAESAEDILDALNDIVRNSDPRKKVRCEIRNELVSIFSGSNMRVLDEVYSDHVRSARNQS